MVEYYAYIVIKKLIHLLSMFDKFCTLTVAYNDERYIGGMLEGVKDLHNLVLISKPWRGKHTKFDKTGEIGERMGAEVIYQDFACEKDERNFGLGYLQEKGFEYVLMLDTDEYFTKEDIYKLMKYVSETNADSYAVKNAKVYWKSWKYHFQHTGGVICVKADKRLFGRRMLSKESNNISIPYDIVFHHFSFSRPLIEMLDKMCTREYETMNIEWIRQYWSRWRFGEDYKNFKIIKTTDLPSEILGRYIKSINLLY